MMPAAVGRDDDRTFDGESPIPPIQRLAQYQSATPDSDATFRPVESGGLQGTKRVYVFVHGWQPGSREITDTLFAESGAATAWDSRVESTSGKSMIESYSPLLAALAERDPDAAVLWFSWVDQSGTDADLFSGRDSFSKTEVNGRRLAIALQEACGRSTPLVHLIGHSHGCVVATHAALSLAQPPRQLTLLDCPEDWFSRAGGAAGLLDNVLPRLNPSRGDGGTFVDSYASMFGLAYHSRPGLANVVDVRLMPAASTGEDSSPVSQAHQYPVQWYADTVAQQRDYGFGWSPMHGYDTTELKTNYMEAGDETVLPLTWREGEVAVQETPFTMEPVSMPEQDLSRSQPNLSVTLPVSDRAILVEFDYDFRSPGRNSELEVAVDHQLKFVAGPNQDVHGRGRYLRLTTGDVAGCSVQFRLKDPGLRTRVAISRLRIISSPKPQRNFNDVQVSITFAGLGGVAGIALTLIGVAIGRRLSKRQC